MAKINIHNKDKFLFRIPRNLFLNRYCRHFMPYLTVHRSVGLNQDLVHLLTIYCERSVALFLLSCVVQSV